MEVKKRNRNAGKHASYKKRGMSKAAIAKKRAYDKAYSARPAQKKRRVELNKANRKAGTYGNGDQKDASHTKRGTIVMEAQSRNRARNGSGKGGRRISTLK